MIPYGVLGMWAWVTGTKLLKREDAGLVGLVWLFVVFILIGYLVFVLAFGTARFLCWADDALLRWLQSRNEPRR
jgi:hypothetical protein